MLEKLDSIDWSKITACDGSAIAVPTALRDLTSEDDEIWQQGYEALRPLLEDQGLVYQVAAYVFPFLLGILAYPHTKEKDKLLQMLLYVGWKETI